jgi:hypothetical protein
MWKEEALRSYIYVIYCFVEGTSRAKLCEENTDSVWVPAKTYTSTGNSFTVKMMSDKLVERNGFLLSYIQTGMYYV